MRIGKSTIALKPKNSAEISEILSFCNTHKLAVCPYGGNTSLLGGSVPVFDEIVLSTELLNKIISVDDIAGKNKYTGCLCNSGRLKYLVKCKRDTNSVN